MKFKFHNKNCREKYYYLFEDGITLKEILDQQGYYYKFLIFRSSKVQPNLEKHLLIVRSTLCDFNLKSNVTFSLFEFDGKRYNPLLHNENMDSFLIDSKEFLKKFKYLSLI